jgi:inosose dehydratase
VPLGAVRIANAPVSWGILEVGDWGETPWQQFLDQVASLDYEGTELGPPGYLPAQAARLAQELAKRSLALAGAFVPVRFTRWGPAELESAMQTARLISAAGCTQILLSDAGESGRRSALDRRNPSSGLTEQEWATLAGAVREIAAACRPLGLRVSFHHHVGSFVETPEEVERLLALVDHESAGLCLDTGHLTWGGGDPVDVVRRHAGRISHLHLKDVQRERLQRAVRDGLDFASAVRSGIFVPLGQGGIDYPAVFAALAEAGYSGWIVAEQDRLGAMPPDLGTPYEGARASRQFLRSLLGR